MFLGIDIGTTAIKIGLLEERKIIYQRSFPIYTKTDCRVSSILIVRIVLSADWDTDPCDVAIC